VLKDQAKKQLAAQEKEIHEKAEFDAEKGKGLNSWQTRTPLTESRTSTCEQKNTKETVAYNLKARVPSGPRPRHDVNWDCDGATQHP